MAEHSAAGDSRSPVHDATGQVDTTDAAAVSAEVSRIFGALYQRDLRSPLLQAFADVGRLYRGEFPGYHGCETDYHDIQHTLEVTLAMARLMEGCARAVGPRVMSERLFEVGTVSALFHDIGYLRRLDDREKNHGAEYALTHVGRGAEFMAQYLPEAGLAELADPAARIVHFTGYEVPASAIDVDPQYRMVGNLLGSADILAQMADRCYLEKCHDRLYPEFVLGGIARQVDAGGREKVLFASPADLIFKTPGFFSSACRRLEQDLGGVYRFVDDHYRGGNLYYSAARRNIAYARTIADARDLSLLRRRPPEGAAAGETA